MQNTHPISLSHVDFSWPDGTNVFTDLTSNFSTGRTGIVGPNGTGKTALLRLVTGQITPQKGTVQTSSTVAYLPQKLTLRTDQTVAELLGLAQKRAALQAVLAGQEENMAENLDLIGDDWDLEERAVAALASFGLPADTNDFLDRTVGTLSGGEAMITALSGLEMAQHPITLLDEPSNNLDSSARAKLYQAVENWRGTLLVATHDPVLLEHVDAIAELRQVRRSSFAGERVELIRHGGNWDTFQAELDAERSTAQRAVRDANALLAGEQRQRIEADTKLARHARQGRKSAEGMPKVLANERRKQAEQSAGKVKGTMANREAAAAAALSEAQDALPSERRITIELPGTAVPMGRSVLNFPASGITRGKMYDAGTYLSGESHLTLRGPERVVLTGANGVGKTTLLEALVGEALVPTGYLRQRLGSDAWEGLDESASVLANVRGAIGSGAARGSSGVSDAQIREELARFHFRGDLVNQSVDQLSGGERFRVTLAQILLARPAPQLLILDEPSNNLDLQSVEQLLTALSDFRGALIVSSHDSSFLEKLSPQRHWELQR